MMIHLASISSWTSTDWAFVIAAFFGGVGYLLKIWKGQPADMAASIGVVQASAQAAHARLDAIAAPSGSAVEAGTLASKAAIPQSYVGTKIP